MEPDSRYLCIVPSRAVAPKVYLPFPEDDPPAVRIAVESDEPETSRLPSGKNSSE